MGGSTLLIYLLPRHTPPPLPRTGATTPDHRKWPTASTPAVSIYTTVAGRNTTPLDWAMVAPSDTPPLQNTFALLAAADEPHTGALAANTDFTTAAEEANEDDQTDDSDCNDGESQPLLDAIIDPIINALAAHNRVLMSTIAGVDNANRALNLALTAVATTLDDDVDAATDAPTLVSMVPTVPHVDVTNAPTMAQ